MGALGRRQQGVLEYLDWGWWVASGWKQSQRMMSSGLWCPARASTFHSGLPVASENRAIALQSLKGIIRPITYFEQRAARHTLFVRSDGHYAAPLGVTERAA